MLSKDIPVLKLGSRNMRKQAVAGWKAVMRVIFRIYVPEPRIAIYDSGDWWREFTSTAYSESGQDVYVSEFVFAGKENGVFVDVGGNHPSKFNNSLLLEERGWTGLAIEPQAHLNRLWPNIRKTPCITSVVGPIEGSVEFVQAIDEQDGLSGISGYNKVKGVSDTLTLPQRRLDNLLRDHNIENVDALFIDVEGYEMHVLAGIDLEALPVKCIVIENDRGLEALSYVGKKISRRLGSNKMRKYLTTRGYVQVARLVSDDVFVHVSALDSVQNQSIR